MCEEKQCSSCLAFKPVDGFRERSLHCAECRNAKKLEYYYKNREKTLEQQKEYRRKNKKKIAQKDANRLRKNRDRINARRRERYKDDPEKHRARSRKQHIVRKFSPGHYEKKLKRDRLRLREKKAKENAEKNQQAVFRSLNPEKLAELKEKLESLPRKNNLA